MKNIAILLVVSILSFGCTSEKEIKKEKEEPQQATTLTLYRSGQARRVAIEGQQ
jgi:outer membrane protein assembly factor BamD (BamD/ComL family)